MLPSLVVFKGRLTGRQIEMELPERMIAVCQEKDWMDGKVMHVYLNKIWYPYVNRVGGESVKSLLVWDSFSAHLTDEVQESLKKNHTTTVMIPGGCTSKLLPLDVSINKPFKQVLRNSWGDYIKTRSLGLTPAQLKDPKSKVPTAKRQDVARWVGQAYLHLKEQTDLIRKSLAVTEFQVQRITQSMTSSSRKQRRKR